VPTARLYPTTPKKGSSLRIDESLPGHVNWVFTKRTTGATVTSINLFLTRISHAPMHP
jgi:hypothetical protein